MRLLILGGTKFLGRHTAEQALARGHEVTLFTRGRTNPELFPNAEHLTGDRDGGLDALESGSWDAVADMTGYVPRVVRASAELLRERVGRYLFVSSVSVYASLAEPVSEDSPLGELEDPHTEEVLENYGPLKAACEAVVQEVYGDRATIVRPGLIVGPWDPTNRFTYWPSRLARGGEILAPAPPERHTQWIDVRDLASWMLDLLERDEPGIFNATNEGVPWGELLAGGEVTWVTDDFLREQEVGQWMELPLWIPDEPGITATDVSRAVAAGLRFRPVPETVRDTAAWDAEHGSEVSPTLTGVSGAGLAPERERELLSAWHGRGA
jgi:2'-hydroxyisoflavone reductase